MTKAPRAVLWDMDGTLLDSAEYHWLSWRDTMAAERAEFSHDYFIRTFGQRNDTILRDLFGADLPLAEVDRIAEAKETLYRRLVRERGVRPLPGVERWLRQLRDAGWRQRWPRPRRGSTSTRSWRRWASPSSSTRSPRPRTSRAASPTRRCS